MRSLDDLLHLLHSDGADELRIRVGRPPILVMDRKGQVLDGPPLTMDEVERLLQEIADSRQRRELREQGKVEFLYKFRERASFIVRAWIKDKKVAMEIH